MFRSILLTVVVAFSTASAFAQVEQPSQISVQGIGLVTKSSNDRYLRMKRQSPAAF
jgi:hypothetical protein